MGLYGYSWLDIGGFLFFAVVGIGYHVAYTLYAQQHPLRTVKGKIHLYRRTWVKRILDDDEPIRAVQSCRNLVMTASFMASTALLLMAGVLNLLIQYTPERIGIITPDHARQKFWLLLLILAFAFITFLQSLRGLHHFTVLIGADPDLMSAVEPVDNVTYLSNLINHATDRLSYGQRAILFTMPVIAWLFHPGWFIAATLVLTYYVARQLDFQSWRPPPAFRKEAEEYAVPKMRAGP